MVAWRDLNPGAVAPRCSLLLPPCCWCHYNSCRRWWFPAMIVPCLGVVSLRHQGINNPPALGYRIICCDVRALLVGRKWVATLPRYISFKGQCATNIGQWKLCTMSLHLIQQTSKCLWGLVTPIGSLLAKEFPKPQEPVWKKNWSNKTKQLVSLVTGSWQTTAVMERAWLKSNLELLTPWLDTKMSH